MKYQDLSTYQVPSNFRGRSAFIVQLWRLVDSTLFRQSPQFMYNFRSIILRMFGAKIGRNVIIRPSVEIYFPWKISIGDRVQIGDRTSLYSLGEIKIGDDSVISQNSYVCAGDHDYSNPSFALRSRPIIIESEAWIGAGSFIGPGVTIQRGAVIGARSSVFSDMPSGMICFGTPCRPIKSRINANSETLKATGDIK